MKTNVKKTIFLTFLALGVQTALAQGVYEVSGTITGANGKTIYMKAGNDADIMSCVVRNNRFSFKGKIAEPYCHAGVSMDKNAFFNPEAESLRFIIEPGKTVLKATASRLADAIVTGGRTQTEKEQLDKVTKPFMDAAMKYDNEYYKAQTQAQRDSLRQLMAPLGQKIIQAQRDFRQSHPDSYLSAEYLSYDMSSMNYDDLNAAYQALTPRVRSSQSGRKVKREIEALQQVRPGQPAPMFSKPDVNGKMFNMADLKGKVVIIDFWASWCVPCRKSNPHMIELYRKYHDRGLEMVYVADNDGSPEAWKKAIQEDGLTGEGFHHVLRGYKQGADDNPDDVSSKYAVHFLPTKYLIDKEGKMVCRIDEGQDSQLDEKLEELLKK